MTKIFKHFFRKIANFLTFLISFLLFVVEIYFFLKPQMVHNVLWFAMFHFSIFNMLRKYQHKRIFLSDVSL